jgi:hypothetical protein
VPRYVKLSQRHQHPIPASTTLDAPPPYHIMNTEMPSLESLIQAHVDYMTRLGETDQEASKELMEKINMKELFDIAGRALGSECYRADKITKVSFLGCPISL